MVHYQNGQLFCEQVALADVVAGVGTPVYVYSLFELLERAQAYVTANTSLACYAVKANGNPHLLRHLGKAGMGADVTSGGELFLAQQAGIPPEKIILSGVGKTAAEIEMALTADIRALHVESKMELTAVSQIAARLQKKAHIGIRVNPNISAETHPYISTGQHSHKFGVPLAQAQAMFAKAAQDNWLEPVGIASHIGSQIRDVDPFRQTAVFLTEVADELKAQGISLRYIDVGGGLGIDYTGDGVPTIAEWTTAVSGPVQEAGYGLVIEPGRSIVGPSGIMIAQTVYTKKQGNKQFVITDAGMNDLLRPTLYKAYHPILPLQRRHGPEQIVDIVGPICESGDWLAKERPLPPIHQGDLLAFLQAGAYGFAMGSNYNGRLRPAEVLVDGHSFTIIRQRQTFEHLLDGT
ncbi:MAG: diaminopimelate decarboxylase [Chloroflexota bacterium]